MRDKQLENSNTQTEGEPQAEQKPEQPQENPVPENTVPEGTPTEQVQPPVVEEKAAEVQEIERVSGYLTASEDPWEGTTNDELFAHFLQNQIDKSLGKPAAGVFSSRPFQDGTLEKQLYDELKAFCTEVANGGQSTTITTITLNTPITFVNSPENPLYVKDQNGSVQFTNEFYRLWGEALSGVEIVHDHLLSDCAYELYWYDKTWESEDKTSGAFGYSTDISIKTGEVSIPYIEFSFVVAKDYSGSNEEGTTTVSPEKINTAKTAIHKAQDIADRVLATSKTSTEILTGFKEEICKLVEYNHDAAGSQSTPYGDPWQMIYVFDGDESTKVVCEGYSKAFQYLFDYAKSKGYLNDFECHTVSGTMDGEAHMWNMIQVGKGSTAKFYLVDVTNSDSNSIGNKGGLFLAHATSVEGQNKFTVMEIPYVYDKDMENLFCGGYPEISTQPYQDPEPTVDLNKIEIYDEEEKIETFSVILPGTNERDYTHQFTAKGIYSDNNKKDVPATWSILLAGEATNSTVEGITVDNNGVLTVTKGAVEGHYALKASYSEGGKECAYAATFRIVKTPKVHSVEITPNKRTLLLPVEKQDVTAQFTATVKDQYGAEMSDQTVTWKIAPADTKGVTVDENGLVTVKKEAAAGAYTVTAAVNEQTGTTGTATLTVEKEASVVTDIVMTLLPEWDVPKYDYDNDKNGTAKVPLQATVKDQYGAEMTVKVTFSLSQPSPTGVEIKDGTLVISSNAAAGNITVTAQADQFKKEYQINLKKDNQTVEKVIVSTTQNTLDVPAFEETAEAQFTATVKDQYGAEMIGQTVVWSMNEDAVAAGVTMVNGKLTVNHTATAGQITVTATVGQKTGQAVIELKKADPVVTTVTVSTGTDGDITVSPDRDITRQYTATIKDQYGAEMKDQTVTWGIAPADTKGVTVDENGLVTVKKEAQSGTITVKATAAGKTGEANLEIVRPDSKATTIQINGDGFVKIPTTGNKTVKYTVECFDQFGLPMENNGPVTWSMEPDNATGVGFKDGTLTVSPTVADGTTVTLKATVMGNITATMQITIQEKSVADFDVMNEGNAVTELKKTYGDGKVDLSVQLTGEGTETNGIWTWKIVEPPTRAADDVISVTGNGENAAVEIKKAGTAAIQVIYDSENFHGEKTIPVSVAQKTLIVNGITAETKEYDGKTDATLIVPTLDGLVAQDDVTLNATGKFEDADAGENKTINLSLELTGADAENYKLSPDSQKTTTATISKKALTITYEGDPISKEYDGTNAYSGQIHLTAKDVPCTLTANGGTFNSKDVATANSLELETITAEGIVLDNYSFELPTIEAIITTKSVEVTITEEAGSYTYNGEIQKPHKAEVSGTVGDEDAQVTFEYKQNNTVVEPKNAGEYVVSAKVGNTNYRLDTETTKTFTIGKATPTVSTSYQKDVAYGDTSEKVVTVDNLNASIEGKLVLVRKTDSDNLLKAAAIKDGKLSFQLNDGLTEAANDKTATITVQFVPKDTVNYNESEELTITVKVTDKTPIEDITVTMANWTYGEEAPDPQPKTNHIDNTGTWTFYYSGNLADGENTAFGSNTNTTKPTEPGKYTVTAEYSTSTHKGSGTSSEFTIAQKELSFTGQTVEDKVYNGDKKANLTGTLALSGVINGDAVTVPSVLTSFFDNGNVGTGKPVTVTVDAITGEHAWKYSAPTTFTLTGNVTKPSTVQPMGDNNKATVTAGELTDSTVPGKTAEEVKSALKAEAEKEIPTIGSNIQYMDITVGDPGTSSKVLIPYPAGTETGHTFTLVRMLDDGTVVEVTTTPDTNGNGLIVEDATSGAYALAWKKTIIPSDSDSSNRHDDDDDDNQAKSFTELRREFWREVVKKIKSAKENSVVKVNARNFGRMPWEVMNALRNNPDVSLTIRWDGGDKIVIPAGKALPKEPGRVYYPLSYLADYDFGTVTVSANGTVVNKWNPEMGGDIYSIDAPELVTTLDSSELETTTENQGVDMVEAKLEAPLAPQTSPEISKAVNADVAPVDHPETIVSKAMVIAAVLAVATAGALVVMKKKREQ